MIDVLTEKISLRVKLIAAMMLAGLLPLLGNVAVSQYFATNALKVSAYQQMSSLREAKEQQIKDYIDDVGKQIVSLAENTMAINASESFSSAFRLLGKHVDASDTAIEKYRQSLKKYYAGEFNRTLKEKTGIQADIESLIPDSKEEIIAQYLYISGNENQLGEKDKLDKAEGNSIYSQLHSAYHPIFRNLLKRYGYYDLFLIEADAGHIVYSVFKELDYATSLFNGPYKDTNFAKVFREAVKGEKGRVYMADYKPYLPSYNAPAWFIATPVFKDEKLIATLIIQLPVERINNIMRKTAGSGDTVDAYVVGKDRLLRSHSRLNELNVDKSRAIVSGAIENAFNGESGQEIANNFLDQQVLASYSPMDMPGLDWVLVVETAKEAVFSTISDLQLTGFYMAIAGVLFIVVTAYFLSKNVLNQLGEDPSRLSQVANAIANEKWSEIEYSGSKGKQTGVLASMLLMKQNIQDRTQEERKAARENLRIRQALDHVKSCVVVTDKDYNLIYANAAFEKLASFRLRDLQTQIPGLSLDSLKKSPCTDLAGELKSVLQFESATNKSVSVDKQYGDSHISIVGSLVKDTDNDEVLGGVFEWTDRTEIVDIEQEIQSIVDQAKEGDLSGRIDTSNKTRFFERLSVGINQMVDVNERSINDSIASISAVSKGDLLHPVKAKYSGAFGRLATDINSTIAKLSQVVAQIGDSANYVLSGSKEILKDNTHLSRRTEQQATNLEETASSMEQMTSTVKQNAENADLANQVTLEARGIAEHGVEVVKKAVTSMNDITSSSKEIVDIIGVIDEIAFQTNLLALNAAVEAARAGEHGRGFAVVASEVRNLAGRSAIAAKEIKELIESSVSKVEEGSHLVNKSGKTLEEIVDSVKKVSELVSNIAVASQEQSEGIELVNSAVSQMDEMTQQNAAMVEQATSASEAMKEQADCLNELVSFFRMDRMTESAAAKYTGEERRSTERPWTEKAVSGEKYSSCSSAAKATTQAPSATAGRAEQDAGTDWEEF